MLSDNARAYWKANLRLLIFCLVVWFVVSNGFGILLVEPLNAIKLGGYKLGFWFAIANQRLPTHRMPQNRLPQTHIATT